jgi:hypothetical protein
MTTESYRTPGLVRIALRAFPAAFRVRYGHDLWQCIRDARRDLGNETFAVTIQFWILIVADLGRSAVVERFRSTSRDSYFLVLRRTVGAVLVAAALANVGYDAMSVKLRMGVFAALLTLVSVMTGIRLLRSGPARPR